MYPASFNSARGATAPTPRLTLYARTLFHGVKPDASAAEEARDVAKIIYDFHSKFGIAILKDDRRRSDVCGMVRHFQRIDHGVVEIHAITARKVHAILQYVGEMPDGGSCWREHRLESGYAHRISNA